MVRPRLLARLRKRSGPSAYKVPPAGGVPSGPVLQEFAASYLTLGPEERMAELKALATQLSPAPGTAVAAAQRILEAGNEQELAVAIAEGRVALEPPWNGFINRLLTADGGTELVLKMRRDILKRGRDDDLLRQLERDLKAILKDWFDPHFLELRQVTWDSPASLLEKLARSEAVHPVAGWEDLKKRLDRDHRLYALFHPRFVDEPLVFVEVALMRKIATSITDLLDPESVAIEPRDATTAIFYSISNAQPGLAGINLGAQLLKSVVQAIGTELPSVTSFATLSPIPGFCAWAQARTEPSAEEFEALSAAALGGDKAAREEVIASCATYLIQAKRADGHVLDPVANFHLSNGARLEQINWLADSSERGIKASLGLMVNYVYRPKHMAANAARYAASQEVSVTAPLSRLAARGQAG